MRDVALYIHIPFCRSRCAYCDFNAYADPGLDFRESYHRALLSDLERTASHDEYRLRSIYIGGGTPSLCPSAWLGELLEACRRYFIFPEDIEVSIEANPGTVSAEGMRDWLRAGINRVSFGVQSLDDDILSLIGRIHDKKTALDSLTCAKKAGFTNISLDLIYGLPTQTASVLEWTLREALELSPQHVSVYELSVEEGTPLARALEAGYYELPGEDESERLEDVVLSCLESRGYEHYEISNWSLPGYACRHNEIYWENAEYLGIGCGAVSYVDGWRFPRLRSPRDYIDAMRLGMLPAISGERLDDEARLLETWILGLRTKRGVNLEELAAKFSVNSEELWKRWRMIPSELTEQYGNRVCLNQRGWDLSNEVFVRFLM